MKKFTLIAAFMFVSLFLLTGCSQTNDPTVNVKPDVKVAATTVKVGTFYNGKDGFSLSIPSGNNSTCIWTYAGGSAQVPYSITTKANTATDKHIITFDTDTKDLFDNFKVSCVDDFGNQYIGVFPSTDTNNSPTASPDNQNLPKNGDPAWNW